MNELNNAQPIPVYAGGSLAGPVASGDKPPSAPASLIGIFFEPVRTFEAFRQRPRFLLAACLIALALSFSTTLIYQRVGFENILRAQLERSSANITPEQKERIVELQTKPVMRAIGVISPIVSLTIAFAAGGALYLLGALAMGASIGYRQALSVWIYSAFPPAVLTAVGNIVVLFLRSPSDIDVAGSARGLVHANLGVFVDGSTYPVLTTAVSSIDLFAIYGLVLAVFGLQKVARISSAKASAIAGSIWLIGVFVRLGVSAVSNAPIG